MPPGCFFHGGIVALCFRPMIALIAVSDLPRICQINLAVMDICDGCLNFPYEVVFSIYFNMAIVYEKRFVPLLRPLTILASSSFGFPTSRNIAFGMALIRCNKGGILNDSFLHIISFGLGGLKHVAVKYLDPLMRIIWVNDAPSALFVQQNRISPMIPGRPLCWPT